MPAARMRMRYWPGYGGWVRLARESCGLSQEELANKLGWSFGKVRNLERNALPVVTFAERDRISEALNFPTHFFDRETPQDHDGGWVCGPDVRACKAPGAKGGACDCAAHYLCDYPMGEGKTCDLALCEDHAVGQGAEWEDMHFCPQHSIIDRGLLRARKES